MATHKLGKLKINTSKDGIAFRFGDGKIHRLGLGRKSANEDAEYEDGYMEGEDYADDGYRPEEDDFAANGYSGRFAAPSDDAYGDEDYEDDAYGDDGYADDGYEDDYGDDYADGRYADDGYVDDDGYYADGEDGYYEDDGAYDDRYLDEDAQDYGAEGYENASPLLRYVDENDWVTYVLLVLLPPLGIYLLWRRRRFEMPIRWAVSGASAVWFIILMILLVSALLAGGGDTTTNPPITMTTPSPTAASLGVEASPSATASLTDGLDIDSLLNGGESGVDTTGGSTGSGDGITPSQTLDPLSPNATATPIAAANVSGGTTGSSGTVYITASGSYYHNNAACTNIESGAQLSTVVESVAIQQGKNKCPICYPGQETYYSTEDGTYYHTDINCSNMKNAAPITKEAAEAKGQKPCPVCITGEVQSLDRDGLKFITSSTTTDKSGKTVYATSGGQNFHVDPNCRGMENAQSMSLLQALQAGKTACSECCASAGKLVWCTRGGTYYHNNQTCSKMTGAYQVTLAEAMVLGKKKCNVCWGSAGTASGSGSATPTSLTSGKGPLVWGTKDGTYYHTVSNCSGMKDATQVSLSIMLDLNRQPCPECCANANRVVYATENGKYYHSYASCSGMKDAKSGTLAQALAMGKEKCPDCWDSSSTGGTSADATTGTGAYVYATKNGNYYHTKSNCSGMSGASHIPLSTAVAAGKTACPTCASAANKKVYSTSGGTYYHINATCSGMKNAQQRTLQEAMVMGQKACPVCIGAASSSSEGGISNVTTGTFTKPSGSSSSVNLVSSGRYDVGTSGIKVYAVPEGKYYHTTSGCSGMQNASYITLETALNYGKKACPVCASSASTKVYAVKGGKYYHYSKTCAGSGAVQGYRGPALALGLEPCPYCVSHTSTIQSSNTYKAGTSGIKVWASVGGKYYHASKEDAGPSATQITLETALNYGKTACPNCASSASKTVYSSASDKYYHSSKVHAGSDAVAGTFAKALALGKKECPVCIGGSESYEESDIKYSAPADTRVYIDVDSDMLYYHKNSRCSDAGMSGGTGVALDFVVKWGFRACPFCNPPTSVD